MINFTKEALRCLIALHTSRLWAIDCHTGSGAKCWIWLRDVDSFVNMYVSIDHLERHAYEVILPNTPCRMVFNLDMSIEHGINKDANHELMVDEIGEYGNMRIYFQDSLSIQFLIYTS